MAGSNFVSGQVRFVLVVFLVPAEPPGGVNGSGHLHGRSGRYDAGPDFHRRDLRRAARHGKPHGIPHVGLVRLRHHDELRHLDVDIRLFRCYWLGKARAAPSGRNRMTFSTFSDAENQSAESRKGVRR